MDNDDRWMINCLTDWFLSHSYGLIIIMNRPLVHWWLWILIMDDGIYPQFIPVIFQWWWMVMNYVLPLQWANMTMENPPFIDDFSIESSICMGFLSHVWWPKGTGMYIHAEPGLMEPSRQHLLQGATPCTQRAGADGRIGSTRMPGGQGGPCPY